MNAKQLEKIRKRWKAEVFDRGEDVDPSDEYVWEGVLIGFLLGAGANLDEAQKIAMKAPFNGWDV